jgi:hypothetical protein
MTASPKEGYLFVLFVKLRSSKSVYSLQFYVHLGPESPLDDAFCCTLDVVGKLSMSRGVLSWFRNVLTYGGEVIEY